MGVSYEEIRPSIYAESLVGSYLGRLYPADRNPVAPVLRVKTPAEQSFHRIETSPSDAAPDALTLGGGSPILLAMETGHSPRPALAALLSALLPGLGQFYNRQWAKGAGFLVGALILDAALDITASFVKLLQSLASGVPPEGAAQVSLRMLPLLALSLWSVVDAARSAKKSQQ